MSEEDGFTFFEWKICDASRLLKLETQEGDKNYISVSSNRNGLDFGCYLDLMCACYRPDRSCISVGLSDERGDSYYWMKLALVNATGDVFTYKETVNICSTHCGGCDWSTGIEYEKLCRWIRDAPADHFYICCKIKRLGKWEYDDYAGTVLYLEYGLSKAVILYGFYEHRRHFDLAAFKNFEHEENLRRIAERADEFQLMGHTGECILEVDGQTFTISKTLLMAHSCVFERMLMLETVEKTTNVINISDLSANSIRIICEQIEGNRHVALEECAEEVFEAADKYELDALKANCVDYMLRTMNADNLLCRIWLAFMHGDRKLKRITFGFVRANSGQWWNLLASDEWIEMEEENPVIADEIKQEAQQWIYASASKILPHFDDYSSLFGEGVDCDPSCR